MNWPDAVEFKKLFDILGHQAPELRAGCRWLTLAPALGPRRTAALLGDHGPPSATDLIRLLRLLEEGAPDLLALGYWLMEGSEHAGEVWVEIQLDRLLAADVGSWEHPTQVLDRPLPPFPDLLTACTARRKRARGPRREQVVRVEAKLERAVRVEASAERRLARQRRRTRAG